MDPNGLPPQIPISVPVLIPREEKTWILAGGHRIRLLGGCNGYTDHHPSVRKDRAPLFSAFEAAEASRDARMAFSNFLIRCSVR